MHKHLLISIQSTLPKEGANLFFQLVSSRYEKGAMILTSNRGFSEWSEVFGDPVIASALLDRLLHHTVVIQIEGASYRLRAHRDLIEPPPSVVPRPKNPRQTACNKKRRCRSIISADHRTTPKWGFFVDAFGEI